MRSSSAPAKQTFQRTDPHRSPKHLPGQGSGRHACSRNRLWRGTRHPRPRRPLRAQSTPSISAPRWSARRAVGWPIFRTCGSFGITAAIFRCIGGSWWNRWGIGRKLQLDFAFSCIVFQHIPNREIIENYVREVNRLLRPGVCLNSRCRAAPASKPTPTIPGWAFRSPRARPAKWPPAADSRCATTTALAANITGSGFLRRGKSADSHAALRPPFRRPPAGNFGIRTIFPSPDRPRGPRPPCSRTFFFSGCPSTFSYARTLPAVPSIPSISGLGASRFRPPAARLPPSARCSSSNEAITRSSFSFSAYKSCMALYRSIVS